MNKVLLSSIACAMTFAVSGCALDQMSKSQIGTGAGAIIGGLIGQNNGGAVGALVGAAVGGGIGYLIGSDMDEEDRKALNKKTQESLDQMQSGQSVAWKSDRTDSQANIKVTEIKEESKPVEVASATQITIPPNFKVLNKTYQATSNAKIYTSTSSSSSVVGTLSKNKTAKVMGKTQDGNWLLVSRNGVVVGFINASDAKVYVPPLAKATTSAPVVAKAEIADLDAMPSKELSKGVKTVAFDLDAIETKNTKTTASVECKMLEVDVKSSKGTKQDSTKACKTPSGTWELG